MTDSSPSPTIAVLLPAAGTGSRIGGTVPKQFRPLAGQPLIRWTVEALLRHPAISLIVPIIDPRHHDDCRAALAGLERVADPVAGGAERQASVRAGLEALAARPNPPDLVLIHDAARPFATPALIGRVIAALTSSDSPASAVIPAVAVTDTLKRAECNRILGTVDRSGLYRAQTPQGFALAPILAAHRAAADQALTDDAAVAEQAGLAVALVAGDEGNIKVTTPDDLIRAETRLSGHLPDIRTGFGYDVHTLGPGDGVWLGGIKIPFHQALVGHSDADVGLHALTDAILGAIGAGDIGQHFPPSDPRWKGAPSDRFLAHAADLVRERGGVIAHVDLTVICEAPKVGPHRAAIIARIAEILGLAADRVSVKATTTEKLGFTGRGEGIAAQAVATVRLP